MLKSPLPRRTVLTLSQRRDWPSVWRLVLHLGALVLLAWGAISLWQLAWLTPAEGLWYLLPAVLLWLLYGAVFSFLGYAGLGHELAHQTVFRSRLLNQVLFYAVSWLTWNNPVYFRVSHRVHHQHTLEQGVDYEVNPDPFPLLEVYWRYLVVDFSALRRATTIFIDNACNVVKGPFGARHFPVASQARRRLVRLARLHLLTHASLAVVALGLGYWQWLPFVTFAAFVCTLPNRVLARLQHVNMARNSQDLRRSTRSVLLAKPLALLYWNMNYHLEHHLHPSVPHFNLPTLRQALGNYLPESAPGLTSQLKTLRMPATGQDQALCQEES